MGLSYDDVLQILKLVDESRGAELHLELDDLTLHVVRAGPPGADGPSSSVPRAVASQGAGDAPQAGGPSSQATGPRVGGESAPASPDAAVTPESVLGAPGSGPESPAGTAGRASAEVAVEGAVAVRSPMVGTFYRCPAPGSPPFVEEGQAVATEDTVGIVEVMKLMSPIKAGTAGRVVRICAEDGRMVESGEVLMRIQPMHVP